MQAMMNLSNHPRCLPASTSQRLAGSPAARSAVRMTPQQPSVLVRADDGFCRDKVSAPKGPAKSEGKTYKVTFLGAGDQSRVIDCPDDKYILDAAEAQGLDLPATCRGGICGACVARVAKGKVDMSDIDDLSFTMSEEEQAQGMTLICMARACSDLEVETQSDWGYSLGVCDWKGATGKFTSRPDPLVGASWSDKK